MVLLKRYVWGGWVLVGVLGDPRPMLNGSTVAPSAAQTDGKRDAARGRSRGRGGHDSVE